jgi:DNA-binding Lrp family transcriptional regulator
MTHPFDKRMLAALERDLPVTHRPFRQVAEEEGLSERDVLDALSGGLRSRVIRRYGALLAHREIGFGANAMVVWQVPEERIEEVGAALSAHARVTHCYQRPPFEGFPYNVYTMVHATNREDALAVVRELAQLANVEQSAVIFSVREFKKESPAYSGWEE